MSQSNFLIGRGELLTHDIKAPVGGRPKSEVYTFDEAKQTLKPQFEKTATNLDSLPDTALDFPAFTRHFLASKNNLLQI